MFWVGRGAKAFEKTDERRRATPSLLHGKACKGHGESVLSTSYNRDLDNAHKKDGLDAIAQGWLGGY